MDTIRSRKQASAPIPGFVRSLNATAEEAGFTVEAPTFAKFYADDQTPSIISLWRGSITAFDRLTFLPESVRMRRPAGADRKASWLTVSWPGSLHAEHLIFCAHLQVVGSSIVLEVNGGPPPKAIVAHGAVEMVVYDDEFAYFGSNEALIAAGTCTTEQFPKSRGQKTSYRWMDDPDVLKWRTSRLPDGRYVHWRENEKARARRCAKRSNASTPPPAARGDGLSDFSSIDDFRSIFTLALCMHSKHIPDALQKLRAIKSRDGHIYGVSSESEERIRDALEELEAEIRDAKLYRKRFDARTEEEKEAARQAVASAERDGAFHTFLQGLNLKPKEPDNG